MSLRQPAGRHEGCEEFLMKVARHVVTGLLIGAVLAFVAELLRPRRHRPRSATS
jgi:hypothetical protein